MGDVESVGLVKFDFLGLKTLTVIDQTIKRINTKISKRTELIDVDNISLNDKPTPFHFFYIKRKLCKCKSSCFFLHVPTST